MASVQQWVDNRRFHRWEIFLFLNKLYNTQWLKNNSLNFKYVFMGFYSVSYRYLDKIDISQISLNVGSRPFCC